jgi:hypothetical protein
MNEDDLYKAIAKALTDWEFVEEALARIFAAFTGTVAYPQPGPSVSAYGAIISFKSRIEMIQAAAKSFFAFALTCPVQSNFQPLMIKCLNWSDRRNDMAHGRVWGHDRHSGYLLFPSLFNTKRQKNQVPTYCYSSREVKALSLAFQNLYDDLCEFAGNLEAWNRASPGRLPR